MKHEPLYHRNVTCVEKNTSICEAARLMKEQHVGDVVVIDTLPNGKKTPVGILTDRDIVVELVAEGLPLDKVAVEDIMCRDIITAGKEADPYEYIWLMRLNAVRRLPVVDKEGALLGIVSADDLLEKVGKELSGLAKISRNQRKVETTTVAAQR